MNITLTIAAKHGVGNQVQSVFFDVLATMFTNAILPGIYHIYGLIYSFQHDLGVFTQLDVFPAFKQLR